MIKVSVIIPTFRPGAGIHQVIDSLDAQTMPQEEFERIFVDDGSGDDTVDDLRALAETRANMSVTEIPNSGWPSRPRNVGMELARGEFVVFMDHDDSLYPDALLRAYEFGTAAGADVVNAREVRTSEWLAYWGRFVEDSPHGDRDTPMLVMPMTPHKMYRLSFLRAKAITFREGARVLWEDFFFNLEAYAGTDKIAVLASTPFYRWIVTKGMNNSSSYGKDLTEYWFSLREILDYTRSGILSDKDRDWMLRYQFGFRVLGRMVGPAALARPESERPEIVATVLELMDEYFPPEIDARLDRRNQARAHLLRTKNADLLVPMAHVERGVTAIPTIEALQWEGAELVVRYTATWTNADGSPLAVRRVNERFERVLPPEVESALPADLLDVTAAIAASTADVTVKSRADDVGWVLPTSREVITTELGDDLVSIGVRATARMRIESGVFGRPFDDAVWNVAARTTFFGFAAHRHLVHEGPDLPAVIGGRPVTAYSTRDSFLSVDLGNRLKHLFATTEPDLDHIEVRRRGLSSSLLVIAVSGAHVSGSTSHACRVTLRGPGSDVVHSYPATLVAGADGLRIHAQISPPPGRYRLRVTAPWTSDKPWGVPVTVRVGRSRRITVQGDPKATSGKHVWGGSQVSSSSR